MKQVYYIVLFILFSLSCNSQNDTIIKTNKSLQIKPIVYKPLSPARAAFYSAVIPGAGQIYNNRYWWQLPLIYGGLGVSFYYYIDNTNNYHKYRDAYKKRKAGLPDQFDGRDGRVKISDASLESAQKQLRQNRDLSLLSAVLVYALQIVEASVTAHLLQFETDDNLTIQPTTIQSPTFEELPKVGLSLKYSF